MVCPRRRSTASPRPSLPVLGTDNPPVATITVSASSTRPSSQVTLHPWPTGAMSSTLVSMTRSTPSRSAQAIRPSRTSRALCEAGKSFSDSSSCSSGMPRSCSKKRICSARGHERMIRRRTFGDDSVTNRSSSTRDGSTLHRPPPLMRILRPPSFVRSSRVVRAPARAAKMAAMVPAAPAPITMTCVMRGPLVQAADGRAMSGRWAGAGAQATG